MRKRLESNAADHDAASPNTGALQRATAEACETGQYEYSPVEIAANDIIVLVDKPGLQTDIKAAEHFNIQYESVGFLRSALCCLVCFGVE